MRNLLKTTVTLLKTTLSLEEQSKLNLIHFYQQELKLVARGEVKPRKVFSKRERNHLRKSGVLLKIRGKSGGIYQLSSESLEALGFFQPDLAHVQNADHKPEEKKQTRVQARVLMRTCLKKCQESTGLE